MATEILMPALSPTMEEGTLAKWLKKEGDTVSAGDIIAEIETDKATMEFEAIDEGTVGKILVPEGTENVKVGEMNYDTFRIDRVQSGEDRTTVWFTPEVPLPVRIHMKDGDDAALDLMLTQYKGV